MNNFWLYYAAHLCEVPTPDDLQIALALPVTLGSRWRYDSITRLPKAAESTDPNNKRKRSVSGSIAWLNLE